MADPLTLAVRLRDIRDTQRALAEHGVKLGRPGWVEEIRPWCDALKCASAASGESVLAIAQRAGTEAKPGEGFVVLRWLAAAVECIEPTVVTDAP